MRRMWNMLTFANDNVIKTVLLNGSRVCTQFCYLTWYIQFKVRILLVLTKTAHHYIFTLLLSVVKCFVNPLLS